MNIMKKSGEQTRANSNITSQVEPATHAGRVLVALRAGPQSAAELQRNLEIAHAPAAVRELRQKGFSIVSERHPWPGRPGKWIKRYRLADGYAEGG
ncbi:helix-turn-helix domain-containing protein [Halomonas salipaludis]